MLGCSCLQLCPPQFCKQNLPAKLRVLLTMSSARKRGFIAMKALIIQFEWDFSDNILLENDDFSMVKKFCGGVPF